MRSLDPRFQVETFPRVVLDAMDVVFYLDDLIWRTLRQRWPGLSDQQCIERFRVMQREYESCNHC